MAAPNVSRSFRFVRPTTAPTASLASLELTASDGTGLRLVSLSAQIVVEEPLAFTELRLTFQNPEPRRLEGRFRIALPPEASVSRFSMKVGNQWQEGEVVEKQAARRAYEDMLHRSQDPALLEQEAGNEFSARVFPIEAHEHKEIILSYSHELVRSGEPYRLPLLGLPELGELAIRALVGRKEEGGASSSLGGQASSAQVVEVRRSGWRPDRDFELPLPASPRSGLRHEEIAVLRVRPELPAEPDEVRSLLVLLDTSASRSLHHERQTTLVLELLRALADGAGLATPVQIVCFDQSTELVFDDVIGEFSEKDEARLRTRLPLGASDLGAALRWASSRPSVPERVLLVSDGIFTAGEDDLPAAVRALAARGVQRLDAITLGGLRDDSTLRRLVTAGLPRDGVLCNGEEALPDLASRLTRMTRSGLSVEIPGASWVWPSRLDGVQPGDERLIYAQISPQSEPRLVIDGVSYPPLELASAERLLLERAGVNARIALLEEMRSRPGTSPDVREALLRQIIEISTRHRVLCAHTALLVLETDADYARNNIDRNALADILTVGLSGIEVLHRSAPKPPPAPEPKRALQHERAKKEDKGGFKKKTKMAAGEDAPSEMPKQDASQDGFFSEDSDERTARLASEEPAPMAAEPAAELAIELEDSSMDLASSDDEAPIDIPTSPVVGGAVEFSEIRAEGGEIDRIFSLSRVADESVPVEAPMAEPPAPPPPPSPAPALAAPAPAAAAPAPARMAPAPVLEEVRAAPAPPEARPEPVRRAPPELPLMEQRLASWDGPFRSFMELLLTGQIQEAMSMALQWFRDAPGDVLALVALGKAAEALGDTGLAARAYGSLIDLFPGRADLRRFAGELLSSLPQEGALSLAIDTFRRAVESRPDHPSGHRLLGMALLKARRFQDAFDAIARGQARSYPSKFPGIPRILAEDLALTAAALLREQPERRAEMDALLRRIGAAPESAPSVRFVLVWETDANDVDFHIHDAFGGHAYFRDRILPSGGELYADVTQGYGPECFTIRGLAPRRAYPYRLQAHYYRRGPMGYGMGSLQIVEHDGQGNFVFEERPYVIQADGAYVALGDVLGPLRENPETLAGAISSDFQGASLVPSPS